MDKLKHWIDELSDNIKEFDQAPKLTHDNDTDHGWFKTTSGKKENIGLLLMADDYYYIEIDEDECEDKIKNKYQMKIGYVHYHDDDEPPKYLIKEGVIKQGYFSEKLAKSGYISDVAILELYRL